MEFENLLPCDGEVFYHGVVVGDDVLGELMESKDWKRDEAVMFGKRIFTKREVAWYGDERFAYRYSGVEKVALPWSGVLLRLREIVEEKLGVRFNSCLANLYHDGSEGMAWHSDGEKMLVKRGVIASLSFGAERRFLFKHKVSGEKVEMVLESGSLLVMRGETQENWLHRLPPSAKVKAARVNLTFRQIEE